LFQYEQVLVLEEDPENGESLLYGPSHFFMSKDDYFFVADISDRRIAVFNSEGQYSHAFGRDGSGPGEFRQMVIQSVHNGIVSIWDFAQRRTTRFRTDGRLLDVTPLPISTAPQILGFFHTTDERMLSLSLEIPVEEDRWEYEQCHATGYDSQGDTLWSNDFGWIKSRFLSTEKAGDVEYQWPAWYHYGPRPWCVFGQQGLIVYTAGIESIIDVYDLDGVHIKQIRLGLKSESPTKEDEDRVRSFLSEQAKQAVDSRNLDHWRSELGKIRVPAQKAFWKGIEVDDAGFIWLLKPDHRFAFFDDAIPHFTWYVVSPEGEYLGQTKRFKNTRIRVSSGHLLAVEQDPESGEHQLIVYAINPAVEGLKYP
jgi:hypothetical protein